MINTIYDKLSLLVKESEEQDKKITVNNYDLKCNNKVIYSFDYELTVHEEEMLDFIYNADNLGFGDEIRKLMQHRISLNRQKQFYTKLFIYEKLSELENDSSSLHSEYVTKLNTGAYDEKPKTVEELLEIYGAKHLKTDKEFRNTVKAFKNIKITTESDKADDTAIIKIYK